MKTLALILWLTGTFGIFVVSANRATEVNRDRVVLVSPPPLSEFDLPTVNILTLGYKNLYDDFVNIWLLQILANPLVKSEEASQVNDVVLKVARLRPKIESLYMLSCFVIALDLKHPEYCEAIILHGLNAFPNSWRLPMTQGFIYAFKLNDPVKAAAFYDLASSRPQSPPYVAGLAKKLLNQEPIAGEEVQEALNLMLNVPGGSRFAEFLSKNAQYRTEQDKDSHYEQPAN